MSWLLCQVLSPVCELLGLLPYTGLNLKVTQGPRGSDDEDGMEAVCNTEPNVERAHGHWPDHFLFTKGRHWFTGVIGSPCPAWKVILTLCNLNRRVSPSSLIPSINHWSLMICSGLLANGYIWCFITFKPDLSGKCLSMLGMHLWKP